MSEIEIEELRIRTKSMDKEQLCVIVKEIPSDILWKEIYFRYMTNASKLKVVEEAISLI